MTALENYSLLIEGIFGKGVTTFDTTKDVNTQVINALNSATEFNMFKANFIARLQRLKRIYSPEPDYLKDILVQVNQIADENNWEGAFAELAAYDFLNKTNPYRIHPIKPNVTLDMKQTYAFKLGNKEANLDGFIDDLDLYFDIKCFKDNVDEILEGIYKDVRLALGLVDYTIHAEYQMDVSYEDFQRNRMTLLSELKKTLKPGITYIRSNVLSSLKYRILWGQGVLTTERTYDSYRHAENYHKLFFLYAKKFVLNKPTLIVMVTFPWFNHVISNFQKSNEILYRSLSRRFFCQYRYDRTKFSALCSKFIGNESIYEVTQSLSGIIFLEDDTIMSNEPMQTNIKSYVYLNPNATNPIQGTMAYDFIQGLSNSVVDDFGHDNY